MYLERPSEETEEEPMTTNKSCIYLKYGFIMAGDPMHQARSFQYVATGPLKPSKLHCYLETKRPALQNKPFERKKWEHEEQSQLLRASTSTNQSALRASYLMAKRIAKAMKRFTTGEELILPATADI